jgi:1,2-diacylglycerol 3-alpha-glucosyltransferase
MRIVMMTNTYLPMVGGVSRSVASFTAAFRAAGHRVLVVAPAFDGAPATFGGTAAGEEDVARVPAIQHFNGSDFSVRLPVSAILAPILESFRPEVVHAHHPFLLGDTALRVAAVYGTPAVFTHHTMYEQYTHYVPGDSAAMKRFAIGLATAYANLCDHVIAPSESIASVLRDRGVNSPISAIPTGIEPARFAAGDRAAGRAASRIPGSAAVIGHVGRLAPEKNLGFLARAVAAALAAAPQAWFLVVGTGPSRDEIHAACDRMGVAGRLVFTGSLDGQPLADAYAAMDVFAFASQSETQGMVLAEAMAAGVPVVAVDAAGAREVVGDRENGRLLPTADEPAFTAAVLGVLALPACERDAMRRQAHETAERFAMPRCADRVLGIYRGLLAGGHRRAAKDPSLWATAARCLEEEWNLLAGKGAAVNDALFGG